jgi:hypothetical protein
VNPYIYGLNNPIGRTDPSGEAQQLVAKTIGKPYEGDCGDFQWKIKWFLSEKSPGGGYIVQKVISRNVKFKGGCPPFKPADYFKKYTKSKGRTFWERWLVKKNQKVTEFDKEEKYDDIYNGTGIEEKVEGEIVILGIAAFYENIQTASFKMAGFETINKETDAGGLESTLNDPKLPAPTSNFILHKLTVKWDCKEGSKSKKSKVVTTLLPIPFHFPSVWG